MSATASHSKGRQTVQGPYLPSRTWFLAYPQVLNAAYNKWGFFFTLAGIKRYKNDKWCAKPGGNISAPGHTNGLQRASEACCCIRKQP
jgi:hypothetical protein